MQPQPQPQHVPSAPSAPTLSRHNTVGGYQPAMNGYANAHGLGRSNTVTSAAPPPVSSHTPSQLQHIQQMSVPLPSFLQVPHTPLQGYAASPPEPERKEALLIDL